MKGDKIMDDSINLNSYKDSVNVPKREYSQLGGARSNKTRFSYRTADDGENLFGIEMVHHHGGHGGSHGGGGGFHVVVACCVSVSTGAAGLRKREHK